MVAKQNEGKHNGKTKAKNEYKQSFDISFITRFLFFLCFTIFLFARFFTTCCGKCHVIFDNRKINRKQRTKTKKEKYFKRGLVLFCCRLTEFCQQSALLCRCKECFCFLFLLCTILVLFFLFLVLMTRISQANFFSCLNLFKNFILSFFFLFC